jgi:hypothetical protein
LTSQRLHLSRDGAGVGQPRMIASGPARAVAVPSNIWSLSGIATGYVPFTRPRAFVFRTTPDSNLPAVHCLCMEAATGGPA